MSRTITGPILSVENVSKFIVLYETNIDVDDVVFDLYFAAQAHLRRHRTILKLKDFHLFLPPDEKRRQWRHLLHTYGVVSGTYRPNYVNVFQYNLPGRRAWFLTI